MTFVITVFVLWFAIIGVASTLTMRWLARRGTRSLAPILWSGAAAAPCVALLVEIGCRAALQRASGADFHPTGMVTTVASCIWIAVGPLLLFVSFLSQIVGDETPRGTVLVQLSHAAMWCWSSFAGAVLFAAEW